MAFHGTGDQIQVHIVMWLILSWMNHLPSSHFQCFSLCRQCPCGCTCVCVCFNLHPLAWLANHPVLDWTGLYRIWCVISEIFSLEVSSCDFEHACYYYWEHKTLLGTCEGIFLLLKNCKCFSLCISIWKLNITLEFLLWDDFEYIRPACTQHHTNA